MIRSAIVSVVLVVGAVAQDSPPASVLGASNLDKFAKMVRTYYADLANDNWKNANKELTKLVAEVGKVSKAAKIADPLLALDDWRAIIQRGLTLEKPSATITGRGELKLVDIPSPIDTGDYEKELSGVFNNRLKALVSVPNDFAKVAYPVILGLHPTDDEVKSAKDLTKAKAIEEKVRDWATATYSKALLAKAIVICPIMDVAVRSKDNVSWSRPRWDADNGVLWALTALSECIFKNANYDSSRIFVDGSGSGSAAALLFCSRFAGFQTGAIVRGGAPERIDFANCRGTPILFVGAESKGFHDEWSGQEGFAIEHLDALDDATLTAWMTAHPKDFAPKKVAIVCDELKFAASYWLRVTDEDATLEKIGLKIDAAIDSEKNEITVVTNEKVKSFDLFLNDRLIDLAKPVKVIHRYAAEGDAVKERVRFNGPLKRILEDALKWSYSVTFCNTGEVYVASISVDLGLS
ncbi:MAG: hypothetical protein EXS13_10270 [Planctomycetes bacterium]|nr:hypothetical protein [Planctomycetota bacterium]